MNADLASPFDAGVEVTKGDIVSDAYSALRISGLTVEPTPEDLDLALMRLEAMAAEYKIRNSDDGYRFEQIPDPATDAGITLGFKSAYSYPLAVRLIADFNKQVPQSLINTANGAYSTMCGSIHLARMNGIERPDRQPFGGGNLNYGTRWAKFYRTQNNFVNVNNANKMLQGEVRDYVESFESELDNDVFEFISSVSIEADSGLQIVSSDVVDDGQTECSTSVTYRLSAVGLSTGVTYPHQGQVTVIATTNLDRVLIRRILFAVYPVEVATY